MTGAAETVNAFTLAEVRTPLGGSIPLHVRRFEEKTFYVLDGTYVFRIGDETAVLGAGDLAFVPRGTPHAYRNASPRTARMLVRATPGGVHAPTFAQIGEMVADPANPEHGVTPSGGSRLLPGEFYRQRYANGRGSPRPEPSPSVA